MQTLLIICGALCLSYAVLMLVYRYGWNSHPVSELPPAFEPETHISVIIPARNEERNIAACIRSILAQRYPPHLFEIIVVDDHSTDATHQTVQAFAGKHVRCIRLAEHLQQGSPVRAYKKKALAAGIAAGKGELIITTDADCIAPSQWLASVAHAYETNDAAMIIAPVDFTSDGSLVQVFQSIDFMTMQGITVAAHRLGLGSMGNGANLAFSEKAFHEVGGYAGTEHLASGDDYLLLLKMQRSFPGKVRCLKSQTAIMRTAPQPDWRSFLQQRIRWASKSGKYDDTRLTLVLMLVYLFNVSFLVLAVSGFLNSACWKAALLFLAVKAVAELIFLWPVAGFYHKKRQLKWFVFLQPLHIAYIILAGLLGFVGVYQWKGRTLR